MWIFMQVLTCSLKNIGPCYFDIIRAKFLSVVSFYKWKFVGYEKTFNENFMYFLNCTFCIKKIYRAFIIISLIFLISIKKEFSSYYNGNLTKILQKEMKFEKYLPFFV